MSGTTTLHVEQPGLTAVQDLGRPGLARFGVAANGAGDRHAATTAAALVGNPLDAPLLETTATGLSFTPDRPVLLAVTGAAPEVSVAGRPQPVWATLAVPAGARVEVAEPVTGLRSYVALRGALRVERTLGSVAPDSLLGVGTRLEAGDTLALDTTYDGQQHPYTGIPLFRFRAARPAHGHDWTIDVTPGPESSEFDDDVLGATFEVLPDSDHVGLRLAGPVAARRSAAEILSRGVPVGAVQVPPAGGLMVLLRGRLLTAGYPVVGVATTASVDRLAQVRSGDRLRFRGVATDDGLRDARARAAEVSRLAETVRGGLLAAGLPGPAAP